MADYGGNPRDLIRDPKTGKLREAGRETLSGVPVGPRMPKSKMTRLGEFLSYHPRSDKEYLKKDYDVGKEPGSDEAKPRLYYRYDIRRGRRSGRGRKRKGGR